MMLGTANKDSFHGLYDSVLDLSKHEQSASVAIAIGSRTLPASPTASTASNISASSSLALLSLGRRHGKPVPTASPSLGLTIASSVQAAATWKNKEEAVKRTRVRPCAEHFDKSISRFSPWSSPSIPQIVRCDSFRTASPADMTMSGCRPESEVIHSDLGFSTRETSHGRAAQGQSADEHTPLTRSSSYFAPWELRDKWVGCAQHGPSCVRKADGNALRQTVDLVGSISGKPHVLRVQSEPSLHASIPKPNRRLSSIARSIELRSAARPVDEAEPDREAIKAMSRAASEEAALRKGLATEWDEIQNRLSSRLVQAHVGWQERCFWEGDTEYFEPALEDLRRVSGVSLSPTRWAAEGDPIRCFRADLHNTDGAPIGNVSNLPSENKFRHWVKRLSAMLTQGVAISLLQYKQFYRKMRHRFRHYFVNTPCTDECFADAFERSDILRSGSDALLGVSYGSLNGSGNETGEAFRTGVDPERRGFLRSLLFHIRGWKTAVLDNSNNVRYHPHKHQALVDPGSCWRTVTVLRKRQQDLLGRRLSA